MSSLSRKDLEQLKRNAIADHFDKRCKERVGVLFTDEQKKEMISSIRKGTMLKHGINGVGDRHKYFLNHDNGLFLVTYDWATNELVTIFPYKTPPELVKFKRERRGEIVPPETPVMETSSPVIDQSFVTEEHRKHPQYKDDIQYTLVTSGKFKGCLQEPEGFILSDQRAHLKRTRDDNAKAQNNRCWWCDRVTVPLKQTNDHLIPQSLKVNHAAWNLVMACEKCNSRRGNGSMRKNHVHYPLPKWLIEMRVKSIKALWKWIDDQQPKQLQQHSVRESFFSKTLKNIFNRKGKLLNV